MIQAGGGALPNFYLVDFKKVPQHHGLPPWPLPLPVALRHPFQGNSLVAHIMGNSRYAWSVSIHVGGELYPTFTWPILKVFLLALLTAINSFIGRMGDSSDVGEGEGKGSGKGSDVRRCVTLIVVVAATATVTAMAVMATATAAVAAMATAMAVMVTATAAVVAMGTAIAAMATATAAVVVMATAMAAAMVATTVAVAVTKTTGVTAMTGGHR